MLTAQQLVSLCCAEAKVPGWLTLGGQKLNMILAELCSYDLDVTRKTTQFLFNPGVLDPQSIASAGSGPYNLPTDWLRANRNDVFYIIQGVKYIMIPVDQAELDAMVAQGGLNAYPLNYSVDNSPRFQGGSPQMWVWPPPSGAFPVTARYFSQMPDIATPETSSTIPWFSYERELYLQRRLTGEMMLLSNDDRAASYLNGLSKDGSFMGASAILDRYLKNRDDSQVPKQVTLDRRLFTSSWAKVPNTKSIGWTLTIGWCAFSVLHHILEAHGSWLGQLLL